MTWLVVRLQHLPPLARARLTSTDFDGMNGVARVCPVNATSKLTFVYREYADGAAPGVIDPQHKGPCAVYMKSVTSAINDTAVGDGWFKIWDEVYDNSTGQWCTEKLMQNDSKLLRIVSAAGCRNSLRIGNLPVNDDPQGWR